MEITLRQLRRLEILAGELNFGRAATRLYITQPALSLSISQLERTLGIKLLVRNTRSVALTPAGEEFLTKLRLVMMALDDAVQTTSQRAQGMQGLLRVGYLIGAGLDRLPRLLRNFADAYPRIRVEIVEYDFSNPSAGLAEGAVDLAVVRPPIDVKDLEFFTISHEGWVACVPEDHRFAQADTVHLSVSDLLDEPIIAAPVSAGGWRDYWIAKEYRKHGPAMIAGEAATYEAEFTSVAQGKGISITSETSALYFKRPGIRFIPIDDVPPCSVALAWSRSNKNLAVDQFIKVAQHHI